MVNCKYCKTELLGDEKFCPKCGQSQDYQEPKADKTIADDDSTLPLKEKSSFFQNRKLKLTAAAIIVCGLLLLGGIKLFSPAAEEGTIDDLYPDSDKVFLIVNSTENSGKGTLRWALNIARSGYIIQFDPEIFSPDNPATIYLEHDLPSIEQGNLTIDGSNAGVIIDGSNISKPEGVWTHGIHINSNGNTVQGLQIVNFELASAIIIAGGSYNTIGGDRNIGAGPYGQGNMIGNVTTGIAIQEVNSTFNTVTGNIISIDGEEHDNNYSYTGIHILRGASNNTIGPDNMLTNCDFGITVCGDKVANTASLNNTLTQNSIYNNLIEGIELHAGGNNELAAPKINSVNIDEGTVEGNACPGCIVEIFSDSDNQGELYEGQTEADQDGKFTFSASRPLNGPNITATVTDAEGNTSKLSAPAY